MDDDAILQRGLPNKRYDQAYTGPDWKPWVTVNPEELLAEYDASMQLYLANDLLSL
jgi:hypothetical protein